MPRGEVECHHYESSLKIIFTKCYIPLIFHHLGIFRLTVWLSCCRKPDRWEYISTQIARFLGPTWGPPGSCRPQMGPCWPLAIRELPFEVAVAGACCYRSVWQSAGRQCVTMRVAVSLASEGFDMVMIFNLLGFGDVWSHLFSEQNQS